jgi:uncharacterized protein (TIGR04255 family)
MPLNPLLDPPPPSVDLPDAPLEKVIIQLRFAEILQIENKVLLAEFQERFREQYPVLVPVKGLEFVLKSNGAVPFQAQGESKEIPMWYFHDLNRTWTVVLTPNFLTLETRSYRTRSDFIDRFAQLLAALKDIFSPKAPIIVTRLGVRYIDRIKEGHFDRVGLLVRPEALGLFQDPFLGQVGYTMSEGLLTAPNEQALLRVRWGVLPPQTSNDPSAVDPLPGISWVLDQDMFREIQVPLDSVEALLEDVRHFSTRMYALFRWVVTPRFLQEYGGVL